MEGAEDEAGAQIGFHWHLLTVSLTSPHTLFRAGEFYNF